jgi:hypothetical protein
VTEFVDGPAAGVSLWLARAPKLLRVVSRRPRRKDDTVVGGLAWDALDQLGDAPAADEQVHVYRLAGRVTCVHVDWHDGRGRRGGTFRSATYSCLSEQPGDADTRTTAAWRAWCVRNAARLLGEGGAP